MELKNEFRLFFAYLVCSVSLVSKFRVGWTFLEVKRTDMKPSTGLVQYFYR